MRSSYSEEDVVLLLKDISGLVEPLPTEAREKLIQSGRHYSEMLPLEYVPTAKYMEVYQEALQHYARPVARAVARLADKVMATRGREVVLVSLARAGVPIGILLKRYLSFKYKVTVPHFGISIVRGRGIDHNAMSFLLQRYQPAQLLFVDGWIGKGVIMRELQKEIAAYPEVSADIAVLADPANLTELCGTHEDILIPSSCLNSTVSGLISRTFLRSDLIGPEDFHGAAYYGELKPVDLSYQFIDAIEKEFEMEVAAEVKPVEGYGLDEVRELAQHFQIEDINFIKPGIGEATRVLLRRVPWKILVAEDDRNNPQLRHLLRLAEEKQVPVEYYPLRHYKCCGIIRRFSDT